jgi:hypothetical protein
VTVALNVTDWPDFDGFALDVSAVVVACRTACGSVSELPPNPTAPAYVAVSVRLPELVSVIEQLPVATPGVAEADSEPVQVSVALALTVTDPVGAAVPVAAVTSKATLTLWLGSDGSGESDEMAVVVPTALGVSVKFCVPVALFVGIVTWAEADWNPAADTLIVSVAGPLPEKLTFSVYPPVGPVELDGEPLHPAVQDTVAPDMGGLPVAALVTVPVTDAFPSVKVVCARNPLACPTAVTTNRTPTSYACGAKSVFVKFPLPSAVAMSSVSESRNGSMCSVSFTDSPACHPDPVIVTVCPGA